mgnify:CR=1 FL=1
MKNWLIAGIVAVVASIASLANAEAPDTLTLNEATMTKLGEGTRRKFVVPLYDIALYISEGQDVETIPTELMNPMALRIEVTSALVSSALFAEALKDGMFSIWLGERPVNRRLKARLLNQRRRR